MESDKKTKIKSACIQISIQLEACATRPSEN